MIDVACAADERFVPHDATMLKSLLLHGGYTDDLRIHFLQAGDVDEVNRALLAEMVRSHGADLRFIETEGLLPEGLPVNTQFSKAAWLRVLLPELLPEVDRVLYLDSDLLVVDSLRTLWEETDFTRDLVAAVRDISPLGALMATMLALPRPERYFNSGVMLLDLDGMRREGTAQKVIEEALARADVVSCADQDPFNVVLNDRCQLLDLRWNVQSPCFETRSDRLPVRPEAVEAATANPAVVHYSGVRKPWQYRCKHPRSGMYAEYRSKTPWAAWSIEGRTITNRLLRPLPEGIVNAPANLRAAVRSSLVYRAPRKIRSLVRATMEARRIS